MAEVAVNIESKVSLDDFRLAMEEKLSRTELAHHMQEKVSFEDMKRYLALHGGIASDGGAGSATHAGPLANRQFDLLEEELSKLKERVEDTFHQVQSLRQMGGGPSSQRDHSSF